MRPLLPLLLGLLACAPQPAGEPPPAHARAELGQARERYPYLPDLGETADAGRGVLDLKRGYYRGDLLLTGSGVPKRGAGVGESVIDGHVTIRGSGWVLTGITIRGDVTIRGDDNDVTGCRIQGRIRVEEGQRNRTR